MSHMDGSVSRARVSFSRIDLLSEVHRLVAYRRIELPTRLAVWAVNPLIRRENELLSTSSRPAHAYVQGHAREDRLVDDAVTFGELQQLVELLLGRVGVDDKCQPYRAETHPNILGDAKRPSKIKISLRAHRRGSHGNLERR